MTAVGKRELATSLLGRGGILVYLDARHDNVLVPFRYKHRNQLILPVGAWREGEGAVLNVSEEGLSGTLRFDRMTWPCHLPWDSIFALASMDGQGTFWRGEARDDPARGKGVEVVPISEAYSEYLVVNGQAIVGGGESVLVIEGQEFPGVKWIDWNGGRARLGGDLQGLLKHLGVDASTNVKKLRFSAAMGYSAGEQRSQVVWDSCRIKLIENATLEFRSSAYHEFHLGVRGPIVYLREWLFRLRAFFAQRRTGQSD
jgi:hypothetical protein